MKKCISVFLLCLSMQSSLFSMKRLSTAASRVAAAVGARFYAQQASINNSKKDDSEQKKQRNYCSWMGGSALAAGTAYCVNDQNQVTEDQINHSISNVSVSVVDQNQNAITSKQRFEQEADIEIERMVHDGIFNSEDGCRDRIDQERTGDKPMNYVLLERLAEKLKKITGNRIVYNFIWPEIAQNLQTDDEDFIYFLQSECCNSGFSQFRHFDIFPSEFAEKTKLLPKVRKALIQQYQYWPPTKESASYFFCDLSEQELLAVLQDKDREITQSLKQKTANKMYEKIFRTNLNFQQLLPMMQKASLLFDHGVKFDEVMLPFEKLMDLPRWFLNKLFTHADIPLNKSFEFPYDLFFKYEQLSDSQQKQLQWLFQAVDFKEVNPRCMFGTILKFDPKNYVHSLEKYIVRLKTFGLSCQPLNFDDLGEVPDDYDEAMCIELLKKAYHHGLLQSITPENLFHTVQGLHGKRGELKKEMEHMFELLREKPTIETMAQWVIQLKDSLWMLGAKALNPELQKKIIDECMHMFEQHKESIVQTLHEAYPLTVQQRTQVLQALNMCNITDVGDKVLMKKIFEASLVLQKTNIPKLILDKYIPLPMLDTLFRTKIAYYAGNAFEDRAYAQELWEKRQSERGLSYTQKLYNNFIRRFPLLGIFYLFPKAEKGTLNYYESGFSADLHRLKNNDQRLMEEIAQVEREFEKQGMIPFVHGRRWEWNFFNDICLMIEELAYHKSVDENKVIFRLRNEKTCNVKQLQAYRNDLMRDGASYHIGTGVDKSGKETEVIFVNRSVLSNNNEYGECTGTYFLENHSIAQQGEALKFAQKMIKEHGLSKIVDDVMLKKLYEMHAQSNKEAGELVFIGVDKKHVDKLIYPAKSGGLMFGESSASYYIQKRENIIKTFPKAIEQDRRFYCLAVPDMPGEYGTVYETRSITAKDTVAYAKYKSAFNAFKKDIASKIK